MPVADHRVGIVYFDTKFQVIPTLLNMAELLAACGYHVDIFTRFDNRYDRPSFANQNIELVDFWPPPRSARPGLWRMAPLPKRVYWAAYLLERQRRVPYQYLIGVDPEGLVRASQLAKYVGARLIYLSLELLLSHELESDAQRLLKAQEIRLSRQCELVVIQDSERAELLVRDNGLDDSRIVYLPNAPAGQGQLVRSDYLRSRYAIPEHRRIILATGTLGTHMCSHQLVASTREWPDDWVLIYQTPDNARVWAYDYIEAMRQMTAPDRVIFALEPAPPDIYQEIIRSADVGVAFYQPIPRSPLYQDNIRHIGRSSGKFAAYLQAGVPALVNEVASLVELVESYQCGSWTRDASSTVAGINTILNNWDVFSRNALRCFDHELEFSKHFAALLHRL